VLDRLVAPQCGHVVVEFAGRVGGVWPLGALWGGAGRTIKVCWQRPHWTFPAVATRFFAPQFGHVVIGATLMPISPVSMASPFERRSSRACSRTSV